MLFVFSFLFKNFFFIFWPYFKYDDKATFHCIFNMTLF